MLAAIRLLSLAVLLASPAAAQQYRGHIRGTVFHPDGSVAAGVPMTVVNEETRESRRVVSAGDGSLAVASLVPGTYRIETAEGFTPSTVVRTDLAAGEDLELDVRLGLTSIDMEADVRPTFVPIEPHSPAMRTRIDRAFIDKLPLDGRDFRDLVLVAPGTTIGAASIAANGLEDQFTSFYLDGFYDTESRLGTPAASLPLDAIDELDVRTAGFDASHGRSAGAQVIAITRSGTNRLGGGATGFFRTDPARGQLAAFAGGPLDPDRTFVFGAYQFTDRNDDPFDPDPGHLLSARADQIVNRSARLTGRYALDDGRPFDRRGQSVGASFHTPIASALTNETRFGLARVSFASFANDAPNAESESYQIANVTTWSMPKHLLSAGLEWYGIEHGLDAGALSASTWGLFVQDDWRASRTISVDAGLRFDRASPDAAEGTNTVSPRVGVAWTADREARTVVLGGYGIYRNLGAIDGVTPRVDGWNVSVRRQIGRARLFEAGYIGNRADELLGGFAASRYDSLQLEFEQRNDRGVSAIVGYMYGRWMEDLELEAAERRSPLDSRHRLSVAFVASLPFGAERLWFNDGLAATILENLEVTGIFTLQSGRPTFASVDEQGPGHRNIDVGIVKNVAIGDAALQLRAETFNLTDRVNLERRRRFQFGGRVLF